MRTIKLVVAIQERIMRYHWSMLSFGSLYTLLLLGVIVARFVMNKPIPRHASMAIIAILLLLGVVRFTCCVCGVEDCPLTIGGMKQTCSVVLLSIILIFLLTLDVPLYSPR